MRLYFYEERPIVSGAFQICRDRNVFVSLTLVRVWCLADRMPLSAGGRRRGEHNFSDSTKVDGVRPYRDNLKCTHRFMISLFNLFTLKKILSTGLTFFDFTLCLVVKYCYFFPLRHCVIKSQSLIVQLFTFSLLISSFFLRLCKTLPIQGLHK
jgi:hypothetical protein